MIFNRLHAATWGDVGKAKEKGFFDFDLFSWMAWTWQTIVLYLHSSFITVMPFGGGSRNNPRKEF